jgi:hydroxymethylbilane synthase
MLERLDGSCRTPIAGLAGIDESDGSLRLAGLIAKPDGSAMVAARRAGAPGDGPDLGRDLAAELLAEAGPGFLA